MKLLFIAFSFCLTMTAWASSPSSLVCRLENFKLHIQVAGKGNFKVVSWKVLASESGEVLVSGSGLFQKEKETPDAFSSYDEGSAVSYKSGRAAFVLPDNQALLFNCI